MGELICAPMALYRYFKSVSKSLPYPEGPLSKTLPSATIKAANEAVLAVLKQLKGQPCVIQTCITINKSIIINNCSCYIATGVYLSIEFFEIFKFLNLILLLLQNFCFKNNLLYGTSCKCLYNEHNY